MRRLGAAVSPWHVALLLLVAAGLALRLWNNDYGLPYVYNVDEGSHFTNRAIEMFAGDPNPHYFQNPSGFTYLLHAAFRVRFGPIWPFGDFSGVIEAYGRDPTAIYVAARTTAALLCMAGVVAIFFVARRLWDARAGIAAAALMAFAFLPVAYSRIAVTDVGTLAPVALSLLGSVWLHERGHRRWFLLAGAMGGLAVGFKYTAGLVLLPFAVAVLLRARREPRALLDGALGALAAAAALIVTTPYLVLDFPTARRQLLEQAETAGEFQKVGQADDIGILYYLDSLTWGFGWVAIAAAVAGVVLLARGAPVRALLLALFPLALLVYLSLQSRYFGRWLLPAYPALALLASYALARATGALTGLIARRPAGLGAPAASAMVLALLLVAVLAQPLAADVRTARLLGRADTRALAREWLRANEPPRLRIVIEPAVPSRYYRRGRPGSRVPPTRKQFVRGFIGDVLRARIDYGATLRPETIDRYRKNGYCMVMTFSLARGRAEKDRIPMALAYYRRLEAEADLVYSVDPWKPGAKPEQFHFDRSFNHYPSAYERPGPEVRIYRLRDCRQGFGVVEEGAGTPDGPTIRQPERAPAETPERGG